MPSPIKVNSSLLSEAGEALFGARWQSELARALGINLRTMQRWAADEGEPPPGVFAELLALAGARRETLRDLAPKLKAAARE